MTFARTALLLSTAVCAAHAQTTGIEEAIAARRGPIGRTPTPLRRGVNARPLPREPLRGQPLGLTNRRGELINFEAPSRQIFRNQFDAEDYVLDLLGLEPAEEGEGGIVQSGNVGNLPALFGEGVGYTIFTIEPCGVNLPHTHPLGTEILYVISGDRGKFLNTAHVETNGGRTLVNNIGVGELVFFPETLLHFQQNLGCEVTQYISGLSFEDAGLSTITFALAEIPLGQLAASLGQPENVVQQLIRQLPEGPAPGQEECLRRCGLF